MGSFDYVTTANSTTDASSYTFSSVSLGTADADRHILVATGARASSARTITGVTIAGISATELRDSSADQTNGSLWIAAVPSGTTGNIVLTYSGTMVRAHIAVFRLVGINPTPVDVDSHGIAGSSSAARTVTLDSVAGGYAVGAYVASGASTTASWSGVTEDYDFSYEASGNRASGGHGSTAGTSVTVTATPSGSVLDGILIAATFQDSVVTITGSIAADTPAVTIAVPEVSWSGTVTPPSFTGAIAADTPAVQVAVPTVAWSGAVTPPMFAGAIAADTPAVSVGVPTSSWSGTVTPPEFTGTLEADTPTVAIGVPTVSWSGTTSAPGAVTGSIIADTPAVSIGVPTCAWTGTVTVPSYAGSIAASTPAVTIGVPVVAWSGTVTTDPSTPLVVPRDRTLVASGPAFTLTGSAPARTLAGAGRRYTLEGSD